MKKALALICVLALAVSLVALAGCGTKKPGVIPADSNYIGKWTAVSAEFKGESQNPEEVFGGEYTLELNADGTGSFISSKDNGPLVWWITDDGIGTNVDNAKRDMKYKADGDKLVGKLLGIEFVLEKVTDAEETEEAEKTASGSARLMIINSEPFVITAKEGFDNFGVTALICDATETYSFTASDENTTWSVFVLDEEFADGARYLPQAETPALEGDGTLEIEAGKYIYILCSENSFSGETASDATLSIDYAPVAE